MAVHELPLLREPEQPFAVVGDWHGNTRWAVYCIELLGSRGVKSVFSAGDFGIWHSGGDEYLGKVRKALEKYDMTLYVTLGNHENYNLVDEHEKDDKGIAWFRHNIAIFPRVFGFTLNGLSVLSLGGAPSIDYQYRTLNRDWWAQEMITDEDVDLAIETAQELGGVDLMITHDAPDGGTKAVDDILRFNPQGWNRKALDYASEGRLRMNNAVYSIKPSLLVHGHYHVFDFGYIQYNDEEYGSIISLEPDGMPHNLLIVEPDNILDPLISWGRINLDFRKMIND